MLFLMNVAPTMVECILNLKALTFHLLQVLCGDVGDSPSCLGYSLIQIRFSVSLNDASTFCVMVVSAYQFAGLQDNMNSFLSSYLSCEIETLELIILSSLFMTM